MSTSNEVSPIEKLKGGERGQTALETAIILIAFVVVASVFAFTILSAGQPLNNQCPTTDLPLPKANYCGLVVVKDQNAEITVHTLDDKHDYLVSFETTVVNAVPAMHITVKSGTDVIGDYINLRQDDPTQTVDVYIGNVVIQRHVGGYSVRYPQAWIDKNKAA